MSAYRKAWVAAAGGALTALGTALADNRLTPAEAVGVALAALTAYGVWRVPNASPRRRRAAKRAKP